MRYIAKILTIGLALLPFASCGDEGEARIEVLSPDEVSVTGNTPELLSVPRGEYVVQCVQTRSGERAMLTMSLMMRANKSKLKHPQMASPVKVVLLGTKGKAQGDIQNLRMSLTMQTDERRRFEQWIAACDDGAVEEFELCSAVAAADFAKGIISETRAFMLSDVSATDTTAAAGEAVAEKKASKAVPAPSVPRAAKIPVAFRLTGIIGDGYDAVMEMRGTTGVVSFTSEGDKTRGRQQHQLRLVSHDGAGTLVIDSYNNGKRVGRYKGRYFPGSGYTGTCYFDLGGHADFALY